MHILFFPNEYAEYAYIFKKAGKFKTEHGAGESKDDDKGISTVPEKKRKKIEKKKPVPSMVPVNVKTTIKASTQFHVSAK